MDKNLLNKIKDFVKTDSAQLSKEDTDESQDAQNTEQPIDIQTLCQQLAENQKLILKQTTESNKRLEELLENNSKSLNQMIGELQKLTSVSERFIYAMEALPKSSREQSEKLSAIEEQLQYEGQTDKALLTNIDILGKNVASLTRFAETQQSANEEFIKNIREQFEPLMKIISKQNRFAAMILASSVIIIILLAILILLTYRAS